MKKKIEKETTDGNNSKIVKPIPFKEYFGKTGKELKKVMEEHNIPEDEQKRIMDNEKIMNKDKEKPKKKK